jgi:hypothetical protein
MHAIVWTAETRSSTGAGAELLRLAAILLAHCAKHEAVRDAHHVVVIIGGMPEGRALRLHQPLRRT